MVAVSAAVLASALTFTYGMRIFYEAFGGPTLQRGLYEPAMSFLAPAMLAAVAGLVLGPAVSLLNPVLDRSVVAVFPSAHPHAFQLWPGFTPELGMTALALAIGMCLFLAQSRVEGLLMRIPVSGDNFQKMYRGVARLGAQLGRPDQTDSSAAYLWRPVALLTVFAGAALWASGALPTATAGLATDLDWPLLVLMTLVVLGVCLARTTLTAVAMLGVLGLLVAVWFVLAGAPDVAMTLLLVEVLTAVAAVVMLAGTAVRFRRPRPAQQAGSAILAIAAGLAAGLATLAFTGGRELSELGAYFLGNAKAETGGENVVNTILVDFRAVDTLGESVVLGTVTLALLLILGKRDAPIVECAVSKPSNTMFQMASRVVGPLAIALSAYLFLRGHYYPGGGFIAALVAGAAVAFSYLAHGQLPGARYPLLRPAVLTSVGFVLSSGVALAALLTGRPFFTPLGNYFTIPGVGTLSLSSSMLFDLGVYVIVLGLVIATVDRLGRGALATEATTTAALVREPEQPQQETKEKVS